MTEDTMQNYRELEIYRGFSIMGSITEKPTTWYIAIRIGVYEDDNFIQRFMSICREFHKADGALNCSIFMVNEAKAMIDKQAEHDAARIKPQ